MPFNITMEADVAKAVARLEAMSVRSKDFTQVFTRARNDLERANAENFTTGGLPVGGWKPRTRDYAWPIMRRTGKLFNSLANMSGPPNVITPTTASFGTNVEYAKFHQYGTTKMAARKILFNPTVFSEETASRAARWVADGSLR